MARARLDCDMRLFRRRVLNRLAAIDLSFGRDSNLLIPVLAIVRHNGVNCNPQELCMLRALLYLLLCLAGIAAIIWLEGLKRGDPKPFDFIHSYWPTTIRVDTDMDSSWLRDEERSCQTTPNDKGRVTVVACNASGSHRDHNIPVTFWGDPDRNTISDWKCRRESEEFVCRAVD
jgi:hypothetical protein